MQLARRTVLAAGVGALLAGCAGTERSATSSGTTSSGAARSAPSAPGPSAGGPAAGALPTVSAWHPSAGDLEPGCKLAAVRRIEQGVAGPDRVLEVIDAQYGGLLVDSASVLVVTRTWTRRGGAVLAGGRTYDVRLSRHGSAWRVDAVHPSRPGRPAAVTATARRVLADDRISLPPAARRDLESGRVHESVVSALLALAEHHRIGISVVRSGHPLRVFGTDRVSDHPQGRAFDTWQVDGHAVVDPRTSRQLVTEYMHAVAAAGSYNVGGPYLLGPAPQWFTDRTHHDHVHAGFRD